MIDLIPVHGGLAQPVNRVIPLSRRRKVLEEAADMPSISVTASDLSSVYRFGDGGLSPLTGPMDKETWHRVLDKSTIEYNFRDYAWTIPLSLPVTDDEAERLSIGRFAALKSESGDVVGVLKISSVFDWDKVKYNTSVYGTSRTDHPGARIANDDARGQLVGGEIWTFPMPRNPEYGEYMLSPREVRTFIAERKWERALAFQTRNPLHRAHEYALVYGVEKLTRDGHFAGAVLNPLMGQLKGDDVPAATRMKCYRILLDRKLLGDGDKDEALWKSVGYDLPEIFALIGLDIKMFYGGPKEAVMHAIYRQNFGFSDLVIGRKHADAPFDDGAAIWGDFDAQEIFKNLRGDLRLSPCNVGFAAFYASLGRVDLMENHKDEKPVFISGSKVRSQLKGGNRPDPRIMRPDVADILIDAYSGDDQS